MLARQSISLRQSWHPPSAVAVVAVSPPLPPCVHLFGNLFVTCYSHRLCRTGPRSSSFRSSRRVVRTPGGCTTSAQPRAQLPRPACRGRGAAGVPAAATHLPPGVLCASPARDRRCHCCGMLARCASWCGEIPHLPAEAAEVAPGVSGAFSASAAASQPRANRGHRGRHCTPPSCGNRLFRRVMTAPRRTRIARRDSRDSRNEFRGAGRAP